MNYFCRSEPTEIHPQPFDPSVRVETFIASRLSSGGRKAALMLRVATMCVAVSMAVMTVALGVVNGFRSTIVEQVAGFAADIQITAFGSGQAYESTPVLYDSVQVGAIRQTGGVAHVQRFALKAGIVRNDEAIQGIVLRGLAPESDTAFLHRHLIAGRIPAGSDSVRHREAVISESLSRSMRLALGDRFEVLFVDDGAPRRDRLKVAGIYRSGMEEFDRMTVFGDMGVVQRLNGWSREQIGGYEVALQAGADGDETARRLTETVGRTAGAESDDDWEWLWEGGGTAVPELVGTETEGQRLAVATVAERYPQLFDWLRMLGLNTTIVIAIMLIVAIVNMSSGVLIVVLEQTRTIGLLKALGMSNGVLQRTFVLRSVRITLRGLLWGNLAGLALCLLQQHTGLLTLDPENYMMTTVPVRIDGWQTVALNAGTLAVVTVSMLLPTAWIARIAPEQSIRFQ